MKKNFLLYDVIRSKNNIQVENEKVDMSVSYNCDIASVWLF